MEQILEKIRLFDGALLIWIQKTMANDFITPAIKFITHLGDNGAIWIIFTILLLLFKKTRRAGIYSALALLSSLLINNIILKNLIARTRPYEIFAEVQRLIEIQRYFSFPSGHSASSFASAVAIYLGLTKDLKKKIGIALIVLATLISFSRLYVGVHYPLDVFVGIADGILLAFGVSKIYEHFENKKSVKIRC